MLDLDFPLAAIFVPDCPNHSVFEFDVFAKAVLVTEVGKVFLDFGSVLY